MPYTNNHGVRLYWEAHGEGPPVLLIMGLSFSHEMWYRVLPALASRCRVLLFDNRGVGASDVPGGRYTIRRMAEDAVAVLDAAGIDSAHIIGASMGGMIAQEMAISSPGRVRSLLLACTSHGGLLARWPRLTYPRGMKRPPRSRRDCELALAPILYAPSTPLHRIHEDLAVQCRCDWDPRGVLSQLAGILLWSSYRRLPSISVPTLVVHGDQDRLIPPVNGRVLATRIPDARFELVPDAGHMLTTDQPEACTKLMLDFLERVCGAETPSGGASPFEQAS